MPTFPASQITPTEAIKLLKEKCGDIRNGAQKWSADLASDVTGAYIRGMLKPLVNFIADLDSLGAVPNLQSEAVAEFGADGVDGELGVGAKRLQILVGEGAVAAAAAARDEVLAALPMLNDGNNDYLAIEQADPVTALTDRMFAPSATATLKAQLDALAATVS